MFHLLWKMKNGKDIIEIMIIYICIIFFIQIFYILLYFICILIFFNAIIDIYELKFKIINKIILIIIIIFN